MAVEPTTVGNYYGAYALTVDNFVSGDIRTYTVDECDAAMFAEGETVILHGEEWRLDEMYCGLDYLKPGEKYRALDMRPLPREYGARGNRGGYSRFGEHLDLWSYDTKVLDGVTYDRYGKATKNDASVDYLALTPRWFGYSKTTMGHINAFLAMCMDRYPRVVVMGPEGDTVEITHTLDRHAWTRICAMWCIG